MFKQRCPKCEKKIDKNYDFCPYCGRNLKSKSDNKDYGFLGKNDFLNKDENSMMSIGGGSILDKMIKKAMQELPSLMKSMEEQQNPNFRKNIRKQLPPNMRIKFMVNGKEIPVNQVNENQMQNQQKQESPKNVKPKLSNEQSKQLAKLPRKEPKTKLKRFSGKLVYELEVPGVNNLQNIIISKLENSIEIKAIAPKTIYSKTININLPILKCTLNDGNLVLELQAK